jgi:hypothetical protein
MLTPSPFTGSCICVPASPAAQVWAVQELVRPLEVAHLIRRAPRRVLPIWWTSVNGVARNLTHLVYQADPPDCDRWCSPAETIDRGGGDCDDLSIFAASCLLHDPALTVHVVIGDGHMWVEGRDRLGGFLLECTTGTIHRGRRLRGYEPQARVILTGTRRAA